MLVVLGGPTASGKTEVAIALALHYGAEIISADSRQFYREMSIGTAKPTAAERAQVPHHLVDFLPVEQVYNAGDFERDALACLDDLFSRMPLVVLTGGSGLYLQAVYEGLDHFPPVSDAVRAAWEQRYQAEGLEFLQRALEVQDPAYYELVDRQNPVRLIRALSVCEAAGKPYSSFRRKAPVERPFRHLLMNLEWPREQLYQRIDARVDRMMEAGFLEEARSLYPKRHCNALQTVGYQELFSYFDGACTLDEAVEKFKQHSRNYAKRQMTWFRRQGDWQAFQPGQLDEMIRYIDRG